jgi:hypothetical protein
MKEIEILPGDNITSAWKTLLRESANCEDTCHCTFNGTDIYSTDTLDEAYKKVTGKTKAECDKARQEWKDEYERHKEEHKTHIPELTKKYCDEARGLILEDEYDYWDKIVPIRLGDLYEGMELGATLDLCRIMRDKNLTYDKRLRKAYDTFMNQGHSGMSAGLVASMLRRFCPDGNDLADAVMNFKFEEK